MSMEIDAKVAELVPNGYCWPVEGYSALLKGKYIANTFDDEVMADETSRSLAIDEPKRVPRKFSTCPSACEEVKKAMLAKGWTWGLDVFDKTNGVEFRCLVFKGKNTSDSDSVGTTEYEAVCLAFVAACGRDKE